MSVISPRGWVPVFSWSSTALAVILLVTVPVTAQETAKPVPLRPTLMLEVRTEVRSENATPGSEVRFKPMQATLLNGSVIPESAVVLGKVISVQAYKEGTPGKLCIRLERATWKDGETKLDAYVTGELITRVVFYDAFGRKHTLQQITPHMPDVKLLRSSYGSTTLMREHHNIVLKKGMKVIAEVVAPHPELPVSRVPD